MKTRYAIALAVISGVAGAAAIQSLHAQAKPPVFLIFDADVKDPASYQPFLLTAVKEVTAQGGRFIVRGAKPEVLSGTPTPNIVSISQWSDKESAMRWFNSEVMKPVKDAQAKYTVTRLSIVEGVSP